MSTQAEQTHRAEVEDIIQTLGGVLIDMENRCRRYPELVEGVIAAVAQELDIADRKMVAHHFSDYLSALMDAYDFDFDPDSWMERNDYTSHFTAKGVVDHSVTYALDFLMNLKPLADVVNLRPVS